MSLEMLGVLAVFPPLFGFIFAGLMNKSFTDRTSQWITCVLMFVALLSAIGLVDLVIHKEHAFTVSLASWIHVGDFEAKWGLKLDALSVSMIGVVNLISFLVHVYSVGYMSHDPNIPRFMSYLSLFTWAMLMLVTAPNLLQLFFGWEGVGLASYLLIGFWYHKPSANLAAIKAFLLNRIGDIGLALGIAAIFWFFGTLDFDALFAKLPLSLPEARPMIEFWGREWDAYNTMACLLFLGAMGKSAQIGLHVWLPDAMEGPTPVSALIHAATMVTAGVFLVVRMSPLFELAPFAREVVTLVGAFTAFFAATVAVTQNDIKRVIAYSTCSQLGYMFFAAGCSAYSAAMFHLMTHAFFKALLFLGAGAVIHAMSDEQDLRRMGGIYRLIPVTYVMMWIGSLALAGIPLFAGYYSKDLILETALMGAQPLGRLAFIFGVIVAFLTAFYSWRLLLLAFHGHPKSDERVMAHVHEAPLSMQIPLAILALGSIFAGMLGVHGFIGENGLGYWGDTIRMLVNPFEAAHHIEPWIKWFCVAMPTLGIILAYYCYVMNPAFPRAFKEKFQSLYQFFLNKWYVDELYERLFVKPWLILGTAFWQGGDIKIIDRFGPDGVTNLSLSAARLVSRLQTGYVYHYAFAMLLGVVLLVGWYVFKGIRG